MLMYPFFHFLTRHRKELNFIFNKLDTGKELCSGPLVSFLTSLKLEKTMLEPVSFFNELDTENLLEICFIF
jgi:hypothetical protein